MITYTYQCKECEHKFDIKQRITEDSLTKCPECKKESLQKVIQPSNVWFKGYNWADKE